MKVTAASFLFACLAGITVAAPVAWTNGETNNRALTAHELGMIKLLADNRDNLRLDDKNTAVVDHLISLASHQRAAVSRRQTPPPGTDATANTSANVGATVGGAANPPPTDGVAGAVGGATNTATNPGGVTAPLDGATNGVGSTLTGASNNVGSTATDAGQNAGSTAGGTLNGVGSTLNGLGQNVGGAVNDLGNGVGSTLGGVNPPPVDTGAVTGTVANAGTDPKTDPASIGAGVGVSAGAASQIDPATGKAKNPAGILLGTVDK